MRRKVGQASGHEFYASVRTHGAIDAAEVVIVLIDASQPLTEQDLRVLSMVIEAGRALVLAFNKWDLVDEDRRYQLDREIDRELVQVQWAQRVNISAKTGRAVQKLVPALETALESWDRRISTGRLNTFFKEIVAATPPPVRGGKQPRILFATQATARPPTFVLFTTGFLEAGYRRFLERRLRETFGFDGSPIRINVRVREKRGASLAEQSVLRRPGGVAESAGTRVALVPVVDMILIALAGVGAGAINAVVGSGTLITFPTLVALGYPPVTSTMSNAVGLVAGSVSGTWGYRRELRGQWNRLRVADPGVVRRRGAGRVAAAAPAGEGVPRRSCRCCWSLALVLVVVGPRIQAWARRGRVGRRYQDRGRSAASTCRAARMAALVVATFAVGVYGGYFTAAQGILLIAAMGATAAGGHAADERGEEPAVAGGEHRRGGGVHGGRVRPDQLGGGGPDRGGFADRRVRGRALWTSALAERAARRSSSWSD